MSYTSPRTITRDDAPTLDSLGSLLGDLVRPLFKEWNTGSQFGPSIVTAARIADNFRFVYVFEDKDKAAWLRVALIGHALSQPQIQELRDAVELFCAGANDEVSAWKAHVKEALVIRPFMASWGKCPSPTTIERKNELLMSLFPN